MVEVDEPDRADGSMLRFAGIQGILVGGFAAMMGLGFFRLAGLIFGGLGMAALGALSYLVGWRRRRRLPSPRRPSDAIER